jgi:M6 family metalloprotease-like protein
MSVPFYGKEFTFRQPDGSQIQVRGYGDQHHALFETLDGFTIVKDSTSGFFHYAQTSDDGQELQPVGVRAESIDPRDVGLSEHLRPSRAATRSLAEAGSGLPRQKTRWEERREESRRARLAATMAEAGVLPAPPSRQTVGDYAGLCLLVDFPDVPGTITQAEVEAFCNLPGYNGFGNNGSVYDYFHDNSGGRLRYTNVVAPYYTAKHPRAYYTNPKIHYPDRARELVKEALVALKAQGFDFTGLTSDNQDYVYALNVFYAGGLVNNWSEGLWPHSSALLVPFELAPGKRARDYQITNIGSELTLGTFCHENGHMVCDFPDLYDYGYESRGTGAYCLMCTGANIDEKNPAQIGAYLKYRAGWAKSSTRISAGLSATAPAGSNDFFLHSRSQTEYFIIENREQTGRDQALPSSGLAIWHVDELGSNNNEQRTPTLHYECSLVQADGAFDLEEGRNDGDATDLFHAGGNARFADATNPNSRWWDGTTSSLEIRQIGQAGPSIMFLADV